ncbi:glycosyltransferase family 39 protein [Halorientalis brevis]|uniref:Glycosyltransferase family 39 protein n=1 Tax=Halorientalis brevis TaxID=1126241 RepID=A0ABD6CB89_9EURY|nr:glycosyltransferase family 39 protein [Halorientalis brevis]
MDTRGLSTHVRARLTAQPPVLYFVVALGAALRLYGLGAESFWIDEYSSLAYVTSRTTFEVAREVPLVDPHPPLYYLLLDIWTSLVGVSEPAVRLLSALFGIAAIPLLYALGAELYDRQVGVFAAGVLAFSRFHVSHSQNVRMYSLLVFATVCSMLFLVRLRTAPTRRAAVGYVAASVALLYTHAFGALVLVAQHCYVLGSRFVRTGGTWAVDPRRWLGVQLAVAVLAVPWAIDMGRQALALLTPGGGSGAVAWGWIPEPTPIRLVSAVGAYVTPSFEDGFGGFLVLVVIGLLALGSQRRVSLDRERTLLLACWIGIPVVALFVVSSLVVPLFIPRYTIAAMPAVALFVAKEIRRVGTVEIRYISVVLLVVALVAGLPGYYQTSQNTEWDDAAAVVTDGADGDDVVLVHRGYFAGLVAQYVHRDRPTVPVERVSVATPVESVRQTVRSHDGDVWLAMSSSTARNRTEIRAVLARSGRHVRTERAFDDVTVTHYVTNDTGGTQ